MFKRVVSYNWDTVHKNLWCGCQFGYQRLKCLLLLKHPFLIVPSLNIVLTWCSQLYQCQNWSTLAKILKLRCYHGTLVLMLLVWGEFLSRVMNQTALDWTVTWTLLVFVDSRYFCFSLRIWFWPDLAPINQTKMCGWPGCPGSCGRYSN